MDLQTILDSINPLPAIHSFLNVPQPSRMIKPKEEEQKKEGKEKEEVQRRKIVLDIFHETQQKYPKLPANILLGMAMDESGGSTHPPTALSEAGARGMMQQMPAFLTQYKISDSTDPTQTVPAAAKELMHNLKVFGNMEDSLAAYNMGRAKLLEYKKKGMELPEETQKYVANISAKLQDLGDGRAPGMPFMQYLTTELIKKDK